MMTCPDCGGAMWDNRETKKSPKQPDYKCKDKNCDKAVWLEKRKPAGGNGGSGGNNRPERPTGPLAPVYGECMEIAGRALKAYAKGEGLTFTAQDLVAATATLFIQAAQSGRPVKKPNVEPKPEPKPVPVPRGDMLDEYDGPDDLPF